MSVEFVGTVDGLRILTPALRAPAFATVSAVVYQRALRREPKLVGKLIPPFAPRPLLRASAGFASSGSPTASPLHAGLRRRPCRPRPTGTAWLLPRPPMLSRRCCRVGEQPFGLLARAGCLLLVAAQVGRRIRAELMRWSMEFSRWRSRWFSRCDLLSESAVSSSVRNCFHFGQRASPRCRAGVASRCPAPSFPRRSWRRCPPRAAPCAPPPRTAGYRRTATRMATGIISHLRGRYCAWRPP